MSENEKAYRVMSISGAFSLVIGIVMLVATVVLGIGSIIAGVLNVTGALPIAIGVVLLVVGIVLGIGCILIGVSLAKNKSRITF